MSDSESAIECLTSQIEDELKLEAADEAVDDQDVYSDFKLSTLSKYTTELVDEEKISQGAGGDIFQCTNTNPETKNQHKKIIVKRFLKTLNEDSRVYRINSVMEFLNNLKASSVSKGFIKPIDLCLSSESLICLVLPFRKYGDLLSLYTRIRKSETTSLSPLHKNLIFYKIVNAVYALHKANVVHRDIKPENILINDRGDLELTDFGYAIDLQRFEVDAKSLMKSELSEANIPNFLNLSLGTKSFKAPELYNYCEVDDITEIPLNNLKKIDVWSLGILYFQLWRMTKPWKDTTPNDKSFAKYSKLYKLSNLSELDSLASSSLNKDPTLAIFNELEDDDLKTMLLKMLNPDPTTRFDIKQVMRNSWSLCLNDEYNKLMSKETDEELLRVIRELG